MASTKSLLYFFAILAQSYCWNYENVADTLKEWVERLENQSLESTKSSGKEAAQWPCYTEDKVISSFIIADKVATPIAFSDLNGDVLARVVLTDKKTIIEASSFHNGLASGRGKIIVRTNRKNLNEDFFFEGLFENGCFDSIVKGFNYLPVYDENDKPITSNETVLTYFGVQLRGQPIGPIWRPMFSADGIRTGFFYAESPRAMKDATDPQNLGGSDLVFIYPNFKVALRGVFDERGRIVQARQVNITAEQSSEFGGIKQLKFSKSFGPIFKYDLSTKTHLSSEAMLRDPYEAEMVDVKQSTITKAGDGVFVNEATPKNTVVSYFNGIRLSRSDVFSWNPFRKSSVYLVEVEDDNGEMIFLDIPKEFSDWNKYQASAGHKVNHGKNPNAAYTECQHPRFGKILCLYTLKDVEKNSELFTRYDITMDQEGMKNAMQMALQLGQWYSGKPKSQFVDEVKPYMQMAAQMADQLDINFLLGF